MPPQKTAALVVRLVPYRETSAIVYLFTATHGMVHAIAKGLRSRKGTARFLERGVLVDTSLYIKAGRDLQTIGTIELSEPYAGIRADLFKSVVRDCALEVMLRTIRDADPHPELFHLLKRHLEHLDTSASATAQILLWRFLLDYLSLLGFRIEMSVCATCGKEIKPGEDRSVHFGQGGCICCTCRPHPPSTSVLPGWVPQNPDGSEYANKKMEQSQRQLTAVTRVFLAFCAYHFEIAPTFKALEFMESLG